MLYLNKIIFKNLKSTKTISFFYILRDKNTLLGFNVALSSKSLLRSFTFRKQRNRLSLKVSNGGEGFMTIIMINATKHAILSCGTQT